MNDGAEPLRPRVAPLLLMAGFGVALIGWIDYVTGTELRVYPLYFLPLSLAAWYGSRAMAVIGSLSCALSWALANQAAGMAVLTSWIGAFNIVSQMSAFLTMSLLISVLRKRVLREEWMASHDALSELHNTRGFRAEAARELARARRYQRPLTVAYVDLDGFKQVNDQHGHAEGDAVLRAVARVLTESVRSVDVLARVGGDEFALLLPETDAAGAQVLLERLRGRVEARMRERNLSVTASIGGTSYAVPPSDVSEMLKQADAQMYGVKASGKNRVVVIERRGVAASDHPRSTSENDAG